MATETEGQQIRSKNFGAAGEAMAEISDGIKPTYIDGIREAAGILTPIKMIDYLNQITNDGPSNIERNANNLARNIVETVQGNRINPELFEKQFVTLTGLDQKSVQDSLKNLQSKDANANDAAYRLLTAAMTSNLEQTIAARFPPQTDLQKSMLNEDVLLQAQQVTQLLQQSGIQAKYVSGNDVPAHGVTAAKPVPQQVVQK